MTFSKLHHTLLTDPDVMDLSPAAFRTWALGIVYAGAKLTDGYVSPKALRRTIQAEVDSVRELVTCGLWSELGDGWQIVNYLEHNQSRQQVEAARESARRRAKKSRGAPQ